MRLLRFIACGSVDDGKSTLIGRLLHDCGSLHEDQRMAAEGASRRWGTRGGAMDFALLLDGLSAEREQGITIDVAYRYFSSASRTFIVADTPGHEQYTRNMVTGASTADAAVLIVDASKGLLTQTRRHAFIASLLGIRHVCLAVNKMDQVGFSQPHFETIRESALGLARQIGIESLACIPVCAVLGDNVVERSPELSWHMGPTLLEWLESVEMDHDRLRQSPFRMPVQWICRPDASFRGIAGPVAGGSVRPGDRVRLLPSGRETRVARIVTDEGDLPQAAAGQSVMLTLCDEVDVSRGDMLCAADAPAQVADLFQATLVWLHEDPMLAGRSYLMKIGARTVGAQVMVVKYQVDVGTFEHVPRKSLAMNEIAVCTFAVDQPIAFDPYVENRDTGRFILIDRLTNATLAAGLIEFALRRSQNLHLQHMAVDKAARNAMNRQKACIVWFTGLSGAGKSTIANLVEKRLHALGYRTYLLDGDNVRHGLSKDLGFTDADRVENIRRVAEVARLMVDAGLIVLCAFISPFEAERRMARALVAEGEFLEVAVEVPLEIAEQRDPKGLYRKARRGELRNFTGIDSRYEQPVNPELRIDTSEVLPDEAAEGVIRLLSERGHLG